MNVRNSAEISVDPAIPERVVSGKTGIRTTMISVKDVQVSPRILLLKGHLSL